MEEFLKSCFIKEVDKRPTAEALLQHPWLKEVAEKQDKKLSEQDGKSHLLLPSPSRKGKVGGSLLHNLFTKNRDISPRADLNKPVQVTEQDSEVPLHRQLSETSQPSTSQFQDKGKQSEETQQETTDTTTRVIVSKCPSPTSQLQVSNESVGTTTEPEPRLLSFWKENERTPRSHTSIPKPKSRFKSGSLIIHRTTSQPIGKRDQNPPKPDFSCQGRPIVQSLPNPVTAHSSLENITMSTNIDNPTLPSTTTTPTTTTATATSATSVTMSLSSMPKPKDPRVQRRELIEKQIVNWSGTSASQLQKVSKAKTKSHPSAKNTKNTKNTKKVKPDEDKKQGKRKKVSELEEKMGKKLEQEIVKRNQIASWQDHLNRMVSFLQEEISIQEEKIHILQALAYECKIEEVMRILLDLPPGAELPCSVVATPNAKSSQKPSHLNQINTTINPTSVFSSVSHRKVDLTNGASTLQKEKANSELPDSDTEEHSIQPILNHEKEAKVDEKKKENQDESEQENENESQNGSESDDDDDDDDDENDEDD